MYKLLSGWVSPASPERFPPFVREDGLYVEDQEGNRYLDAKSMLWNVSFGHGVKEIHAAITEQLEKIAYCPTMDGHRNLMAEKLAALLVESTPSHLTHAFLSISGTAACEVGAMIARAYWQLLGQSEKNIIISADHSYHGQSFGMTTISGFAEPRADFEPLLGGCTHVDVAYCYRCPFSLRPESCHIECADVYEQSILALGADRIAAIIIEPLVGSVIQPAPAGYFERLKRTLKQYDVLLIVDEVATGFGRLGAPFACELYDLNPDILCLGKAISNGVLPLAATLFSEDIYQRFFDQDHTLFLGSTQDGNPVCAAAGIATVELFNREDWSGRARVMGKYLLDALQGRLGHLPCVGEIRGVGLFLGIELVEDRQSRKALDIECLQKDFIQERVLVHLENNIIALAPPLTIDRAAADQLVEAIERVLCRMLSNKSSPSKLQADRAVNSSTRS